MGEGFSRVWPTNFGAAGRKSVTSALLIGLVLALGGCHADADDPAGQAGELSDPVRRANAISNITRLYTRALSQNEGDRAADAVKSIADATVEKLVECYTNNPADNRSREQIISLFGEMRDPRSIPALIEALDWEQGIDEESAVLAATTIRQMDIPSDQMGPVIEALGGALGKVRQERPIDDRIRKQTILALGATEDERIRPILTEIVNSNDEAQKFLVNRLALIELIRLADESMVPMLLDSLFVSDSTNPNLALDDVATEGLVRVGSPAVAPALSLLNGENESANNAAARMIRAAGDRAGDLTADHIVKVRAIHVLGELGSREALSKLMEIAEGEDEDLRWNAAKSLVRLNLQDGDVASVVERIKAVYGSFEANTATVLGMKANLIAALRNLYRGEGLPFVLEQAKNSDLHPDVRREAVNSYAMLANKSELERLSAFLEAEPASADGGHREFFQTYGQEQRSIADAIAAGGECDEDLSCWIGKLESSDIEVGRKATYMVARLGRGNAEAVTALVGALSHDQLMVRLAALTALDHAASSGSPEAVARIDELTRDQEGSSEGNNFAVSARPVRARLANRQ